MMEGTRSLEKRPKETAIRGGRLLFLALWVVLLMGCRSKPATMTQDMPMVDNSMLVLRPGDELEAKFRFWPELNDRQFIRPDGKITLQEVDDVQAAGLTPAQLDASLTQLYANKLKDPVISVVIRSLSDRHVYVNGEVKTPGIVPMTGPMTALEAILSTGGFDIHTAKMSNVVLIRHIDGRRYARLLDLSGALKNGAAPDADVYLAPQDIVFVPRTKIEEINQWVDNYINRLLPAGLTYSQVFGNSTYGYTPPGARIR